MTVSSPHIGTDHCSRMVDHVRIAAAGIVPHVDGAITATDPLDTSDHCSLMVDHVHVIVSGVSDHCSRMVDHVRLTPDSPKPNEEGEADAITVCASLSEWTTVP